MKLLFLAVVSGIAFAQTPPLAEFDVASIKLNKSNSGNSGIRTVAGLLRMENTTVRSLLVNALGILDEQIVGTPPWISSERYDIEAKYEVDEKASRLEVGKANNARLQALLVSRFNLKFHRETKELQTYALVVGKKGPKLKSSTLSEDFSMHSSNGHWEFKGADMEGVARNLSHRLGRLVVNETALEGKFDFTLDFDQELRTEMRADNPIAGIEARKPSLFTAVQDQLGLKLEARKSPVDMLVVDRIGRPSDN